MRRLLPLLVVFGLLAGSGPAAAQDKQVIKLWHAYRGGEQQALEASVARLHEHRPDLEVRLLAVPYEAYRQRLTAAVPRGNGPDLFIAPHEAAGEWAANRIIVPATLPMTLPHTAFIDATIQALVLDGELMGVPLAFKSLALYYNLDLIGTVPRDLPTLLREGARVAEVPLAYELGNFYHHAAFLHAFGGRVFDAGGEVHLDTTAFADSMDRVAALVQEAGLPPEADGALVSNLFNQGRTAFVFNGPWFLGELREDLNFGVAPMPVLEPGGPPLQPFLTVDTLFRAANSDVPEADVHAVIEGVAGLEGSLQRALLGRQAVAFENAHQDPRLARDAVLSAFAAQARAAVPMPNRPEMGAVWEPANRALRSVIRGASTGPVAAIRAQKEVGYYLRPPPQEASPGPYVALLGLILLGVSGLAVFEARRTQVVTRVQRSWTAYLYLLPAAVGMVVVVFVPFLVGSAVALFAHQGGEFTFVGLRNFGRILTAQDYGIGDPLSFWFTLFVTVAWTVCNVALHTGIGLGLALLLRDPWMKLKGLYRVLLIVPWAVPNYITALIWKGMFNRQFGAVNGVLGLFGVEPVSWFSSFATSFAANVTTNTWLGFPFMMVVTLGALQAIPRDLEEAAAVDGASAFDRFRHVTMPLLKPALLPAVILGSVWTFNMFNIIYLVSAGEPGGSTEILISEAYKWAFTRQAQYGYASAYALLIFGILIVYTLVTARVTQGSEAAA